MKYFVSLKEDTTVSTQFPIPAKMEAVEATRPYLDNLKKNEKIVDWGFYGAGHGLYAICNVRTHAELHEIVELLPVRALCSVECSPVLEGAEFSDVFGKIKQQALATHERLTKAQANRPSQY